MSTECNICKLSISVGATVTLNVVETTHDQCGSPVTFHCTGTYRGHTFLDGLYVAIVDTFSPRQTCPGCGKQPDRISLFCGGPGYYYQLNTATQEVKDGDAARD